MYHCELGYSIKQMDEAKDSCMKEYDAVLER
jgi:hypothetical protein